MHLIDRSTEALLLIFLPIKAVHLTLLYSKSFQRFFSRKCHLFLELLTEAYRNACSEGEAEIYRAHVAVLGNSEAVKHGFIERLWDKSTYFESPFEIKGVKASLIKSKFNKVTQNSEGWKESRRDSSELMTGFRNAVVSHIRSVRHCSRTEGENETLKQSNISSADSVGKKSFVARVESKETRKQDGKENVGCKLQTLEKEFAAQFQKPDSETLFFLHRNAQIKDNPDKNIPYSVNLWEFYIQDEFSAMNHLFLKAEALILYVTDISLDLMSPLKRNWDENSKTPTKLLRWLNLVHIKAKKRNLKPNIVLLLTHTRSIKAVEQNPHKDSYIKKILNMVEGKPYAPYISKETIILVDNSPKRFKDIRSKLFDRIMMQPSWGVKRSIRWLHLEAELLRRTTYKKKSYLHRYEIDQYDDERRPHLPVSKVKELALAYGMDNCEVDSFLEFHHVLGDFICCPPSSLGSFIIIHPQWLLDKFSKLLAQVSHPHRHYELLNYPRLRSKAIVSMGDLHKLWGPQDARFLTDLMINVDFLLPPDNQKQVYLVPCMLPPEGSYLHETEVTYSAVHILKELEKQHVETFQRLLCLCTKQSNWKLDLTGHLSNRYASFDLNLGTHLILNQKNNTNLEVSTWTSIQELAKGHITNDEIRAFLIDIHKEMSRNMETLGVARSKVFRMLCPHWKPGDEFVCLVEIEEKPESQPDDFVFHPISDR